MMGLQQISDWFWDTGFWLPPNTKWEDVSPYGEIKHTNFYHLFYPLPTALVLLIARYFLEKYCYEPLGLFLGINPKKFQTLAPQPTLEAFYKKNKKPGTKEISDAARQVQWTEYQTARWFRRRLAQDWTPRITRFSDYCFHFTFYTYSFCYGLSVLWNKPWFWDITQCWYNYPNQDIDDGVWWYYMGILTFYWAWIFTQFVVVHNKDFWEMLSHHFVTMSLIFLSWVCNLTRGGILTLFVHEAPVVVVQAMKMARCAKYQKVSDILFIFYIILWVLNRLLLFPFWIIYSCFADFMSTVPMFPAAYLIGALFVALFGLHLYRTFFIIKLAYETFLIRRTKTIIPSYNDSSDDCSSA